MKDKARFVLVEFLLKHKLADSYYKPGNRAMIRDHIAESLVDRGIAKKVVQQITIQDTVLA